MTSGGKSLTQAPENLKEAIDWVIKIKNNTDDLSKALQELLKEDGSDVAVKVLDKYRIVSERDVESVGTWALNDQKDNLKRLVNGFAEGLNKFVEKDSGIVQNPNISAYNSATSWNNLTTSDKRDCAAILLGIMPVVYIGITYLYWQCEGKGGWAQDNLNDSGGSGSNQGTLKQYMVAFGYAEKDLNSSKNGGNIATQLQSAFSKELQKHKSTASSKSYPNFLVELQKKVLDSTPSQTKTDCPLTSLYLLSYYYITNFLYTVVTTSPGTPSFLGYSGFAALGGGAYGFNLGGLGTFVSTLLTCCCNDVLTQSLTEQVKHFFEPVKVAGSGVSSEHIEKVREALSTSGSDNGLIGKLADGLRQFIGYDGSSNGAPKITGAGIAPSNIATHRLCDATIAFTIGVLEILSKDSSIKDNMGNKEKVDGVISKLSQCYGKGPGVFEGVAKEVEKLGEVKGQGRGNFSEVNSIINAVKTNYESQLSSVNSGVSDIHTKVGTYLENIFKAGKASPVNVTSQLQQLVQNANPVYDAATLNSQIGGVKRNLTPPSSPGFAKNVLEAGKNALMARLEYKTKYISYYDKPQIAKWPDSDGEQKRCAKIFLGCLPLYYQALTYIYWGCHENGGGWNAMTLGSGALRSYFDSQGLLPLYVDRSKRGAHIADSALNKFSEFSKGMTKASPPSPFTYSTFTQKLLGLVKSEGSQNIHNSCPLSALYNGASCYFRYQQIVTAKSAGGAPKTIREMLYFLAALQFSPQYDEFDSYVTSLFRTMLGNPSGGKDDSDLKLQVAVSGSSKTGETLSAADLKSYVASTFHLASAFIGFIQEPSTSGEPWLHSLFSNSQFNLSIPSSGPGIFSVLSNYTYALQFQLSFLYIQCRNTYTVGCGWNQCTFGKTVNQNTTSQIVESHICSVGCTTGAHKSGDHASGYCGHDKCGTKGKPSPLQAFLTDRLKGFSRGHPSDPSSHLATCSGSLCHVPMGFESHLRADDKYQGSHISATLRPFCGGSTTPLRQLSEKLGCLTKRTPRTLGDVFGFTWHLKGQLAKTLNNVRDAQWFGELQDKLPFSYQLKNDSGGNLKNFVGTAHTNSHDTADLTSLYSPKCKEKGNNCGPYLYPLTYSDGATYAPAHAAVYLSWVLYLTDELYESLQEFLDTFNGHACKNCTHRCAHSTASPCSCP
ncbi:variant erythrocyte surface antigen-1 family protein [Babesia caballi]|uniref:Variant erythrocyte surface antigen-1 family protein n=1 Tax=Babesia caballi TaxID=5871 RepID=A0AAV4LS98_BABCB|nr:variant erythrocyte surface antigen-1 family protein [Babesia caballi]